MKPHSKTIIFLIRIFGNKTLRTSYKKEYIDYGWTPFWSDWTYTYTERV